MKQKAQHSTRCIPLVAPSLLFPSLLHLFFPIPLPILLLFLPAFDLHPPPRLHFFPSLSLSVGLWCWHAIWRVCMILMPVCELAFCLETNSGMLPPVNHFHTSKSHFHQSELSNRPNVDVLSFAFYSFPQSWLQKQICHGYVSML